MNRRTIILTLIFITAFLLNACTSANGQSSELSWAEAETLILSGDVWQIAQTHDLEVTLYLGDGQIITTMEPYLDAVFQVVADCGDPCTQIVMVTE